MSDSSIVADAIRASGFPITEVVSGGAPGVDTSAEQWAERHGIPVTRFPADWKRYGRRAGPIRNQAMAEYGEALVAVWDGKSRGTKNMIRLARKHGLRVFVYLVGDTWEAREPVQPFLCAA